MKPTDILMNEHRIIEIGLKALDAMSYKAATTGQLDAEDATQAIEFFVNFADRCHHGKEEAHLFSLLEQKGFIRDEGPTGVMMREHDIARDLVKAMKASIETAAKGEETGPRQFAEHAKSFSQLMNEHISKEDHCLFPMANECLNDADNEKLHKDFHETEHHDLGLGEHKKYVDIAKKLAKKYNVDLSQVESHVFECGCSH